MRYSSITKVVIQWVYFSVNSSVTRKGGGGGGGGVIASHLHIKQNVE